MSQAPFIGKRIVVFTAHPDDEGLAAGTMHENQRAGGETFLICATSGEKGKSHLKRRVTDAQLKRIRQNELLQAAKILGVKHIIFLGLPDSKVRENAEKLYKKSSAIIQKIKPDYMLSFGPEGISAHWDHITVGKAARRIAKKLKIPLAAFTLADTFIRERRREFFLARRKFGKYKGIPVHRKGDLKVRIDLATKRKAMRSHASQFTGGTPFSQFPKKVQDKLMGYEYFVRETL